MQEYTCNIIFCSCISYFFKPDTLPKMCKSNLTGFNSCSDLKEVLHLNLKLIHIGLIYSSSIPTAN